MTIRLSRNFTDIEVGSSPSLETKIDIFEDRVLNWQLNIAELIRAEMEDPANAGTDWNHAAFGLMHILFTYFEMIAQHESGEESFQQSEKMFCKGVNLVYPKQFSMGKRKKIYKRIRCGLFHNAFMKQGALISGDYPDALEVEDGGNVKVNPHKLSPDLKAHFEQYIADLRDPKKTRLRKNFEKLFRFKKSV